MKTSLLSILCALFSILVLTACNPTSTQNESSLATTTSFPNATANTVAYIGIEGMTCEMGCAKFIESKLNGLDGVLQATVHFKDEKAEVKFDETTIGEEELISAINKIADDKYTITNIDIQKLKEKDSPKEESGSNRSEENKAEQVESEVTLTFPNIFDAFIRLYN